MNALSGVRGGTAGGAGVRRGEVLLTSLAAVSWCFLAMAGTAALGLHLLGADAAGSLGSMTAAVVALAVGGSVSPSGDVSAFGLEGAEAETAIDITPLGVSLVGALVLALFFLRSLRRAGAVIGRAELAARTGTVAALFLAVLGGLAWAGQDTITFDGSSLGLDGVPGGAGPGEEIADQLPDGLGDIAGLLPDRLGDLADARASVGFTVDVAGSLLGGACWVLGVLLVALLSSRRTPLPAGWGRVHSAVRPAASALATVLLVAVLAGLAAAAYAAAGDENPGRIAGAALLGAPNGVWLGISLGLLVPWEGSATGEAARALPGPLDEFLRLSAGEDVTLGSLAGLDGRVWLLGVAAAVMMLSAGVLAAARTPVRRPDGLAHAGRCASALGAATAVALPLLVRLTGLSADASLSVLGFDAFDTGIELRGSGPSALVLGALWGAAAGGAGALLARRTGAAGQRAAPYARAVEGGGGEGRGRTAGSAVGSDSGVGTGAAGPAGTGAGAGPGHGSGRRPGVDSAREPGRALGGDPGRARPDQAYGRGPYSPSPQYRPAPGETNPYLRPPEPPVYGAPTVPARPVTPPPRRGGRPGPPPPPERPPDPPEGRRRGP